MTFKNLKVVSYNKLSKKDKKNIHISILNISLEKDKDYVLYKCKDKIELLHDGNIFIAFKKNIWIPTLKLLRNKELEVSVYLDNGAVNPIKRGADIMAPGIFKYKDKIERKYKKNDILPIKVETNIMAIGLATIDLEDIKKDTKGQAMINLHYEGDELDELKVY